MQQAQTAIKWEPPVLQCEETSSHLFELIYKIKTGFSIDELGSQYPLIGNINKLNLVSLVTDIEMGIELKILRKKYTF